MLYGFVTAKISKSGFEERSENRIEYYERVATVLQVHWIVLLATKGYLTSAAVKCVNPVQYEISQSGHIKVYHSPLGMNNLWKLLLCGQLFDSGWYCE